MLRVLVKAGEIGPGDTVVFEGHPARVAVVTKYPPWHKDKPITFDLEAWNGNQQMTVDNAEVLVEAKFLVKDMVARLGDALDTFPEAVRIGLVRAFCVFCGRRGCAQGQCPGSSEVSP